MPSELNMSSNNTEGYSYTLTQIAHDLCQAKKPLIRTVYFTQKPMGRAGSTGQINKGDLKRDSYSKAVYYDSSTNLYHMMRHNEPEERVPSADIVAMMRSFLRMAPVSGAFVTISDTDPTTGRDTIVRVIRSFEVDPCESNGGNQLMMGAAGLIPPLSSSSSQSGSSGGANWKVILVILAVVILGGGAYYYFVLKNKAAPPPPMVLPPSQPYILRRR